MRRPALRAARLLCGAVLGLSFALGGAGTALAQSGTAPVAWSDTLSAIYRFEQWELDAEDGARRYRVQLAVPKQAAPPAGFPVLYLLDGNAAFAALDSAQLAALAQQATPPVIAAIGYATAQRFDTTARAYDYTPPMPGPGATMDQGATERPGGGADIFLALIEQRIKPAVRGRAAIDPARQSLWGHSYGGLFVLHTMLRHPAAFQRYIAADASFWWQNGYLLQEEQQAAPVTSAICLLVMSGAGAWGNEAAPARPGVDPAVIERQRALRRSVPQDTPRQFAARQAQRTGVQAHWREFAGASHGAMLGLSLAPALQLASAAAPCTEQIAQDAGKMTSK
ncbi:MAG: alpha/beta hydrolase-fold protein [Duganella sp.]